ncbi:MAG: type II secretion system protein [Phycisphaerales bacterium]|nr:type II secretion system protein [Phycisphaerales bacterium]
MAAIKRQPRAFTLVELLLVVAIIILLLAIFVPALRLAREQARIAKCMANQRVLMAAGLQFLNEKNDLPWTLPSSGVGPTGSNYWVGRATEFGWGGAMPNKTNYEFAQAGLDRGNMASAANLDVYRVPPKYRPLNPYLSNDVYWSVEPNVEMTDPREVRAETPGFFICPSDVTSRVGVVGEYTRIPTGEVFPTWEYWGSSYTINWYWSVYYVNAPPGNAPPYTGGNLRTRMLKILGFETPTPAGLGRQLLRSKDGRFETEFVVFSENAMSLALEIARPPGYSGGPWATGDPKTGLGWHGQRDRFVAANLDGGVRYRTIDTRYVWGTGWTIWPQRPWGGDWAGYSGTSPD